MGLRIVIFGPGRVGTAFARRLVGRGVDVLGFVGRDPGRTAAAVAAVGAGAVLAAHQHASAHVVLFAVGDAELPAAIAAAAAAAPPRPCSLWLHTSGRHGLEVFAGIPGIRRGLLHPVAPFAEPLRAAETMVGAPGVFVGEPNARRLLRQLCVRLGLVPVEGSPGDRVLYHAACALAANGLTALFAAAQQVFAAAGVVDAADARRLLDALLQAALRGCAERGPAAALSGPVRRGDAETVAAHLQHLQAAAPAAVPVYRATAVLALALAESAGLPADRVQALRQLLAD